MSNQAVPRRPKWHIAYFFLAAFDLLVVSGGLYLNHRIMGIYTGSVDVNQQHAEILAELADLGQFALDVNAPGNDVFDTRDVDKELSRRQSALGEFQSQLSLLHHTIEINSASAISARLHSGVDTIKRAMDAMLAEADLIFLHFRQGKFEAAGRRMATMDRKYADVNRNIAAMNTVVRSLQLEHFEGQVTAATDMRRFEFLLGGAIVLMVLCIMLYGHKIAKELKKFERNREFYVADLEKKEAALMSELAERKRAEREKSTLEQQLRHAQKMEALGTLAGGTAHEFNNMLMPIMGLTELAMREIPEDSRAYSNLNKVLESGDRATHLVDKILAFSHTDEAEQAHINLGDVVDDVIELLQSTLPATAVIRAEVDREHCFVSADETQIHQVLINLASNAVDALDGKVGTLDIGLATVRFDDGFKGNTAQLDGGAYARLSIRDDGSGMDEETMLRIFEPFFTTKDVGKGTGLGLAMIHAIVTKHGGAIEVESVVGRGTTFGVFLPLLEEENEVLALVEQPGQLLISRGCA